MTRGKFCEDLVCNDLINKGYKLYKKNFKTPCGEVDLVLSHKTKPWLMVEVKSSGLQEFTPYRLGQRQKYKQQLAHEFLQRNLKRQLTFYLAIVDGHSIDYFLFSEI